MSFEGISNGIPKIFMTMMASKFRKGGEKAVKMLNVTSLDVVFRNSQGVRSTSVLNEGPIDWSLD